jgi:hypothetical protein
VKPVIAGTEIIHDLLPNLTLRSGMGKLLPFGIIATQSSADGFRCGVDGVGRL